MELDIRGLGIRPTRVLKRHIERRLRRALRSFDIDRATVRLLRDHGHSRHGTHRCDVSLSAPGFAPLLVKERHGSIRVACSRAAAQAKRALVRTAQRARRSPRSGRGGQLVHDLGSSA